MTATTSIAESATSAVQARQLAERDVAVAKKALDHQKAQGEAAVSLIDAAGQVEAANARLGASSAGRIDVYA